MTPLLLAGLAAISLQAETPDPLDEAALCATITAASRSAIAAAAGTADESPQHAAAMTRIDALLEAATLHVETLMTERGMELTEIETVLARIQPRHEAAAADAALLDQTLRRCIAAYPAG